MTGTAYKIMLLGAIGVGKSSIAQRLVFDRFEASYKPTIGVDVYRYDVTDPAGGDPIRLILWDSDGNLGDAIFRHIYLKEASGAIIIGDVTRSESLTVMINTAREFRNRLPGRRITYVLNKMDLASASSELPSEFGGDASATFRTSALTGDNVREAVLATARSVARTRT